MSVTINIRTGGADMDVKGMCHLFCPRCRQSASRITVRSEGPFHVTTDSAKVKAAPPCGVVVSVWCANCDDYWNANVVLARWQQVDRIERIDCKGTLGDLVQDDPALMPTVSEPPSSKLYETVDATAADRESEDKRMGRVQFDVPVNVPATRSDPMHEFAEDIRAVFERHGFSVGTPAFSGLLAAIAVVEEGKGSGEGN